MIYVSSSCVKHAKIKDSVEELALNGFKNIELSGGTQYYEGFENDLLDLKAKYNLNYLCHNYFPPPKEHFVLNLASLNDEIYEKSFNHLINAIELSKELGAKRFGFHAGFLIDIRVNEIGKKITRESLFDKTLSLEKFCQGFKALQRIAAPLELYLENNVFSSTNFATYEGEQFFMLCCFHDYQELRKVLDFNLLLDVAHLKVSSHTLSLNFEKELHHMLQACNYVHISDNDALHDLNHTLTKNSELLMMMQKNNLSNKDFTLEIYDNINKIKESYTLLQEAIQ